MNLQSTSTFQKFFIYLSLSFYLAQPVLGITLINNAGHDVVCAIDVGINQGGMKKLSTENSWRWETNQDCFPLGRCTLNCTYLNFDGNVSLDLSPCDLYNAYGIVTSSSFPELKLVELN